MKNTEKHYELLSQEIDDEFHDQTPRHHSRRSSVVLSIICVILAVSNVVLLAERSSTWGTTARSPYASLTRDVPDPWRGSKQDYASKDHAVADAAWENLNVDAGTVALTDEYVASMGLPRSQRFPWDDEKGLYQLNAYHNLHCLKVLYHTIAEARDGLPLSTPIGHSRHCLDALRQDVICNADDTPRYTGMDQPDGVSGLGQTRQCKDWSQLEAWAEERTACFRFINTTDPTFDTLERYKFCPEGSPYQKWIDAVFGEEI